MIDILDRPKLLLEQKILDQNVETYDFTNNSSIYIHNVLKLFIDYYMGNGYIIPLYWWKNGIEIIFFANLTVEVLLVL